MIVLITGATSGFGKSCAELFFKKGYKVILIGRRKDSTLEVRSQPILNFGVELVSKISQILNPG